MVNLMTTVVVVSIYSVDYNDYIVIIIDITRRVQEIGERSWKYTLCAPYAKCSKVWVII